MRTHLSSTLSAFVVCLFMVPAIGHADNKVVAKIDGAEITEQDLRFAKMEMGPELQNMPVDQQRLILLEYLLQNHMLATAGKKQKVDSAADFKERLAYYKRRAMRDAYVEKYVRTSVKEEEAKKFYDDLKSKKVRRASHILVKTEDEAKAIIAELKKGTDFAKLAKEKSIGPSKTRGGDLGTLQKGRMVPVFEKAAFALKKDEISVPVKSDFGWHVIKITELKDPPLPPYEKVKGQILLSLVQKKEQETIREMRGKAKIEILDKKMDTNMKAIRGSQSGTAPAKEEKKK